MERMIDIDHDVRSYLMSCSEDVRHFEDEMYRIEKQLNAMKEITGFKRFVNGRSLKAREEQLKSSYEMWKTKRDNVLYEIEIYKTYGTNPPTTLQNYQKIKDMMIDRVAKMDIVAMIDMGMM